MIESNDEILIIYCGKNGEKFFGGKKIQIWHGKIKIAKKEERKFFQYLRLHFFNYVILNC